jgi:redox-sensitive bicupin YhaK (pirin superfamily)
LEKTGTASRRAVERVVPAPRMLEGAGFEVRRPFPARWLEAVGPFILLDHIGPADIPAGAAVGAPTHPHAGLETLTYFIEGRGMHLDSMGNSSTTGPGEAQWMRAGRGIIHDEGPDEMMLRDGGRSHGVQLWLNMPQAHRRDAPAYRQFGADEFPLIEEDGGRVKLKLIAGEIAGRRGPLETFGEPLLAHIEAKPGGTVSFNLPAGPEVGVYVLTGSGIFGPDRIPANEGELALFAAEGSGIAFRAGEVSSQFMLVGGAPIEEPLFRYGPFVAGSKADMHQTLLDYQAGRFGELSKG